MKALAIFLCFFLIIFVACSQADFTASPVSADAVSSARPGVYTLNATVQAFVDYSCPRGVLCKPTATPSYVVVCADKACKETVRLFDPKYQFVFTAGWEYSFLLNVTGDTYLFAQETPRIDIIDAHKI